MMQKHKGATFYEREALRFIRARLEKGAQPLVDGEDTVNNRFMCNILSDFPKWGSEDYDDMCIARDNVKAWIDSGISAPDRDGLAVYQPTFYSWVLSAIPSSTEYQLLNASVRRRKASLASFDAPSAVDAECQLEFMAKLAWIDSALEYMNETGLSIDFRIDWEKAANEGRINGWEIK